MAIKPSSATRAPRQMPELGRKPKGLRVAQVIAGGELLLSSPVNLQRRWKDMFEIILDATAALIFIGVVLFILGVVLRSLGFAFPFIFDLIFERKESVRRKETERIMDDGNFDVLIDKLDEPLYKRLSDFTVKKKIIDIVKTILIVYGLMVAFMLGGSILIRIIGK
jgi:hypothetical protein